MVGELLQHARGLAAAIATTGGFTVAATLSTPDNATSIAVTGLGTGTWMLFEDLRQNKPNNSRSNSFDIPVAQLIAADYPYKNANGKVDLRKHKIMVTDADGGLQGTFVVNEDRYNATLGLVVMILGATT